MLLREHQEIMIIQEYFVIVLSFCAVKSVLLKPD
jgi:hypothetical protein